MQLNFIKSYVFIWVINFQGLTANFACLPTLSRTFIAGYICLTKNKIWVFNPGGGGYAPSFFTQTHVIYYYYCLHNRESRFWTLSHFRAHYTFTKNDEYQHHAHTPDLTRCYRAYEMHLCHFLLCHATCTIFINSG